MPRPRPPRPVTPAATPASLCAEPHTLCDDFDGPEFIPRPRWTELVQSNGGKVSPSTVAKSAPGAMLATLAPGNGRAWASKDVDAVGAKGIRCRFTFRHDLEKSLSFFEVDMRDDAGKVTANLELSLGPSGGSTKISAQMDGGTGEGKEALTAVKPNAWHALSFEWTFGAGFDLDIEGGTIIRRTLSLGPRTAASLQLRVGLGLNSPEPGKREMLYDDVVCDLVR